MAWDLTELAQFERQLQEALPASTGLVDEAREQQIYAQYDRIARAYCELAQTGSTEALKRLTFLWWYAVSEPTDLSGVEEFAPDLSQRVAAALTSASDEGVDPEFRCMLGWYYSITDWLFDADTPSLVPALRALANENRLADGEPDLGCVDLGSDRGQMGDYFRSIRAAQEKRAARMPKDRSNGV